MTSSRHFNASGLFPQPVFVDYRAFPIVGGLISDLVMSIVRSAFEIRNKSALEKIAAA
jgi:hypothetical protein